MKKKLVLLCAAVLFSSTAIAGDQLYFVGVEKIPPISYEENGVKKGLCYDLFQEVSKRLNLDVKVDLCPFNRSWKYLQDGDADGMIGLYYKKEREEDLIYAKVPLYYVPYHVFVKNNNQFDFRSLEDLYGKRVGKQSGWSVSEEFESAVKAQKILIDEATQIEQNLMKLNSGRIDAYVGNYYLAMHHLKLLGLQAEIVALPKPIIEKQSVYVALSKKGKNIKDKPKLIEAISKVINEIHNDGTLQKIKAKYF